MMDCRKPACGHRQAQAVPAVGGVDEGPAFSCRRFITMMIADGGRSGLS